MSSAMMYETIWFDKDKYDTAEELLFQAHLNGPSSASPSTPTSAPVSSPKTQGSCSSSAKEIAEARRKIQQTLSAAPATSSSPVTSASEKRMAQLETENKELRKTTEDLTAAIQKLELRVSKLESGKTDAPAAAPAPAAPVKEEKKKEESDDDDDVDLFGSSSDEDDEEQEKIKAERLAAYQAKKAKKPQVIAKSTIVLDVKPWDDETDLAEMESKVRSIQTEGLLWGASKIIPIAYGIKKLQIGCVVEDDKVGTDFLEESITGFEDFVQSVDIVAFNKI
ncbi:elongation factor 1-delta-like isoform X1 [Actinia tenebrosa]|uniref:Elongation factor 1-delta-like isoform X1 n=1 Tax=Actinia tenebrosa TaxID=6105 RepID=A0A6P8HL25_ACTTE|nr:elongation factor 1-delta-like isoform X1 [Actinia tenebrosa]